MVWGLLILCVLSGDGLEAARVKMLCGYLDEIEDGAEMLRS